MSENRISYASRTYDDYKKDLLTLTQQYYPDIFGRLDDASIGNWLISILADMGDNLNFYIDRTYNETSLDSASSLESLLKIARSNGLKIEGKKSAMCEIAFSCNVPTSKDGDLAWFDENYCPIIKRGTLFSNGTSTFELTEDLNFAEQFDSNGISNRKIEPLRDSNGKIVEYRLTKLSTALAGQSKIYKRIVSSSDIKPFMEVLLTDSNILNVESILVKDGLTYTSDPTLDEFYQEKEIFKDKLGNYVNRYFEVNNLIDQYRFGEDTEKLENGKFVETTENEMVDIQLNNDKITTNIEIPIERSIKCKWLRLKNKFITEFDDEWNLKIIFGSGLRNAYGEIPNNAQDFTKYMMSRMEANDYMGVLPKAGSTMYILYRVGGGEISNIATDTLTNIIYNNYELKGNCEDGKDAYKKNRVRQTFSVTNPSPSYGGKDEPSEEEIKYMIKYNNASQNRCVTLHDYKVKINQLPAKYGCPFRTAVVEENNKVIVYALGLNSDGTLSSILSENVASNIINYLSHYKMLNDFIEFRSGKIINIAFELTIYVEKSYDKSEVAKRVIDAVYDYMDITKHEMGDDIFLGDLTKQISQMDGVIQLSELKAFNRVGKANGYSDDVISQELLGSSECGEEDCGENQINLKSSDMMLFSESNAMYEILNKNKDITVIVKQR